MTKRRDFYPVTCSHLKDRFPPVPGDNISVQYDIQRFDHVLAFKKYYLSGKSDSIEFTLGEALAAFDAVSLADEM